MKGQAITRYGVTTNRTGAREYWQGWYVLPGQDKPTKIGLGPKSELSERAAEWKLREIMAGIIGGEKSDGKLTLGVWCTRYLERRSHELGERSVDLLEDARDELVAYFGEGRRLESITREEALDFRAKLSGRKLAENTVCKKVGKAKMIFQAAVDADKLARNPFAKVRSAPPKVDRIGRVLSIPELERIIEHCPSDDWRSAFALARLAGLRLGEIRSLAWGDIDFDKATLVACAQTRVRTTKKRRRVVPVQPRLLAILTEHHGRAPAAPAPGSLGPCVTLPKNNLYRLAHKIIDGAGVEEFGKPFHAGRGHLESEWLAAGIPAHDVAKWIGHSIQVSHDCYHQVLPETLAKVTGKAPESTQSLPNKAGAEEKTKA